MDILIGYMYGLLVFSLTMFLNIFGNYLLSYVKSEDTKN